MWARVTVVMPRCAGQPMYSLSKMKKISSEIPVMTSGMISGDVIMPENMVRPRNFLNRAKAIPAIVPRIVAIVALIMAI